jgi:hypothetical protein
MGSDIVDWGTGFQVQTLSLTPFDFDLYAALGKDPLCVIGTGPNQWNNRTPSTSSEILKFPSNLIGLYYLRVCAYTSSGTARVNVTINGGCSSADACLTYCASFTGFDDDMEYYGQRFEPNVTKGKPGVYFSGYLYEGDKAESHVYGHESEKVHNLFAYNNDVLFVTFFNHTTSLGISLDSNFNTEKLQVKTCLTKSRSRDSDDSEENLRKICSKSKSKRKISSEEDDEIVEPVCTLITSTWTLVFQKLKSASNGNFSATIYSSNLTSNSNSSAKINGLAYSYVDRVLNFAFKNMTSSVVRIFEITGLGKPRIGLKPKFEKNYFFNQLGYNIPSNFTFDVLSAVESYSCTE